MPQSLENLVVWKKSLELADFVHACTKAFPSDERYGLCSQLSRASASIAANIAEGYGRIGRRDYARFLGISRGSAYEVFTYLSIATRRNYQVPQEAFDKVEEVLRILNSIIEKLNDQLVRERGAMYGMEQDDPSIE